MNTIFMNSENSNSDLHVLLLNLTEKRLQDKR